MNQEVIQFNLLPTVIIACGSFNPLTNMHLRMMELAKEKINNQWNVELLRSNFPEELFDQQLSTHHSDLQTNSSQTQENAPDSLLNQFPKAVSCFRTVVCGILSPVSDGYKKKDLAPASDRINLARMGCETTSDWLTVDDWEASQTNWTRTRLVLDQFRVRLEKIHNKLNASDTLSSVQSNGDNCLDDSNSKICLSTDLWLMERMKIFRQNTESWFSHLQQTSRCSPPRKIKVNFLVPDLKFVCGADLLESFRIPNLWLDEDAETILRDYGLICISRSMSNPQKCIHEVDILNKYQDNITMVTEWCANDISSTLVRRALGRGENVRYLIPDAVLNEIYARGLYGARKPPSFDDKEDGNMVTLIRKYQKSFNS